VRGVIEDLIEFSRGRILEVSKAYHLSQECVDEICQYCGFEPEGGWRNVVSLAAGTKLFRATKDGFVLESELTPEDNPKEMLVDSFRNKLILPTAAADLLVIIGVHPTWGVQLIHSVNGGRLDSALPESTLKVVREATYNVIDSIPLEPGHFKITEMAKPIRKSIDAIDHDTSADGGPRPFLKPKKGVEEFVKRSVLDRWLVPAGVATRYHDGTFTLEEI